MSTYLPGYQHDIFVSYAAVDDEPSPGAEAGWVSILSRKLQSRIGQLLGRSTAFSLWMDYRLGADEPLPATLLHAVERSALLIIILSPEYLASEWCHRERNPFLQRAAQQGRVGSGVFVVERNRLAVEEKPEELRDLLGYRFWVEDQQGRSPRILGNPKPNPEELLYYAKLNDLAYALAQQLQGLRQALTRFPNPVNNPPAIYLAEVSSDLETQRDAVSRYLDQAGFQVLPKGISPYSRYLCGTNELTSVLTGQLQHCQAFVQLLSGSSGKRLPGQPGFPWLQYEMARQAGKLILQWHSPELQSSTVTDSEQRALLEDDQVFAMGLEEFKRAIVKRASVDPVTDARYHPIRVFLNCNAIDHSLGMAISGVLKKNQVDHVFPLLQGKPADLRKDLDQRLMDCDGVIIVYGSVDSTWVRQQLLRCRRILAQRKRPLKILAVYEGPPQEKETLKVASLAGMTLNCRRGLNENELRPFLEALQAGANG
jgi:hypothetical protein